jgi:hypothetical protein
MAQVTVAAEAARVGSVARSAVAIAASVASQFFPVPVHDQQDDRHDDQRGEQQEGLLVPGAAVGVHGGVGSSPTARHFLPFIPNERWFLPHHPPAGRTGLSSC